MKTQDFHFDLPSELIAQVPLERRVDSRLLCLSGDSGPVDRQFANVIDMLDPGDLLVLNDTRVIPARLHGNKASGGKLEVLIERITDEHRALCHIRCSRSPKPGTRIVLEGVVEAEILGRQGALFDVQFDPAKPLMDWLLEYGHMPLPPYIERSDEASDQERYQTVFAEKAGAVAAPTAGLHFDQDMMAALEAKGVRIAKVTLHVGAGTFQPVKVDEIAEHTMHSERIDVGEETCRAISETRSRGGRVVAVGTTVVRSLESLPEGDHPQPYCGETDIFITPGFSFRFIDVLITNFHLPCSTLLMLVSALGGYDKVMSAYRHAVEQRYRFFSYGDAMWVENQSVRAKPNEI
ncbi:S-adenosylmethionine:tRNA ribosyltransferase-isomerase [gamma proteobacterium HTCC5015]|nr:S-adenosylmethionine:tRNA ribosyltransferase-isomerase [gamma proteobacterium HTCC5015]